MKKLLFIAGILITTLSNVSAQQVVTGGFRRAGTNAQVKAMQKDKIKERLNISDDQAKSVDAIQQDFKLKMRAINIDTQLSAEEKKTRLKELQMERKKSLQTVITENQIAKLDEVNPTRKKTKYHKKSSTNKRS